MSLSINGPKCNGPKLSSVSQEVKLLAKKEDREGLDSSSWNARVNLSGGFRSFFFLECKGGIQVKLCGIAQYGNLIGVTIGYTITASISMVFWLERLAKKAESFQSYFRASPNLDSIRTVEGCSDIIVMRHFESGAAQRAAATASIPVINAGDGPGQHPTQIWP